MTESIIDLVSAPISLPGTKKNRDNVPFSRKKNFRGPEVSARFVVGLKARTSRKFWGLEPLRVISMEPGLPVGIWRRASEPIEHAPVRAFSYLM